VRLDTRNVENLDGSDVKFMKTAGSGFSLVYTMLLNAPHDRDVVTDGTSADKKKRMRLATVASSVLQVTVGQSKRVPSSRELCTVKCRHVVLLCQTPDTLTPIDCTSYLQRLQIRAG
jgi:hypothetical protein